MDIYQQRNADRLRAWRHTKATRGLTTPDDSFTGLRVLLALMAVVVLIEVTLIVWWAV